MKCPKCQNLDTKVIDSRLSKEGNVTRRRRECTSCGERFTTHERLEEIFPMIIKKDNRREEYDREKIMRGLNKAFEKRPVSIEEKEEMLAHIEGGLKGGDREVKSSTIGEMIMAELKSIDEVAYVRFASVYRSFRDVNEFMDELTNLLKEKK